MTEELAPYKHRTRRRRAHVKSRKGCAECKRRHIKCDEGRPSCSNCITTNRACLFYEARQASVASSTNRSDDKASTQPDDEFSELQRTQNTFTTAHLTYLHHAENHLGDIMGLRGDVNMLLTVAIDRAPTAPYLLDQVLALSAAHLATTDSSRRPLIHHQAVELQTRALEMFNKAKEEICEDNCIPIFLFTAFLGVHVLGETLRSDRNDLSRFLDSFVGYARLHRGVCAVITKTSWASILASDLQPLLYIHRLSNHVNKQTPGTETSVLSEALESSELDSAAIIACQTALKKMQWVLDMCKQDRSRVDIGIQATIAWPLLVPQEYLELLHRSQPEALLIMVFYAAVLHRYRHYWVFGRVGSALVTMISANIGSHWHDSPAWPNHVLFETGLF